MKRTMVISALVGLLLASPVKADEAWNRMRAEHAYATGLEASFSNACHRGVPVFKAWDQARNGAVAEKANLKKYHAKDAKQIEAEVAAELPPCENWHLTD